MGEGAQPGLTPPGPFPTQALVLKVHWAQGSNSWAFSPGLGVGSWGGWYHRAEDTDGHHSLSGQGQRPLEPQAICVLGRAVNGWSGWGRGGC